MIWLVAAALASPHPYAPDDPTGTGGAGEPTSAPPGTPADAPPPPADAPPPEPAPAETAPMDPAAVPATMTGRVLEHGSGLPAVVTVTGTRIEAGAETDVTVVATTDESGRYTLLLPQGRWKVTAEGEQHRPQTSELDVEAGSLINQDWRLDRYTWSDEVVVWGEENREEANRTVISADELRRVPGSFGDPIRAIQSLPGVARSASLEGDIVVRGSEGINTGTYVDEIPIPYLFHFFIGRSVVNPSLLDDVEFFAGGMPVRFGDVTQAVVNTRTLDTTPEPGVHGRIGLDLLDFSVSGEGRIGHGNLGDHLSWQVGYRVSWVSALIGGGAQVVALANGVGAGGRSAYPSISYQDHLLRLAYDDPRDKVALTVLGARDALIFHPAKEDEDLPVAVPWDPNRLMDTRFERIHLRWDRKVEQDLHTTWIAVGPDRETSLVEGVGQLADGIDFGKLSGWTVDATRRDRFQLGEKTVFWGGLDVWLNPMTAFDYQGWTPDGGIPTTSDFRSSSGLWAELQRKLGERTWIGPGVRLPLHTFNGRIWTDVEPRLTMRQGLHKRWTLVGFAGRFTQIPPIERYAEGFGNPDLELMRAVQVSAGVEGRWPSGLQVDGTVYATRTENIVVKDLQVVLDHLDSDGPTSSSSPSIVPSYSPTLGVAYGVEGFVRMRPSNGWFGWVSASVGRSLRLQPDGEWIPGDYDLPVALTLVGSRELPYDVEVSGRFRLTSGYPYTPLHGAYDATSGTWSGVTGDPNSERFPVFRQLDMRIDKTFTGRRARWTVYLDVMNALNTRNPFLATYDTTYTDLEPQIWIPIIPNVGLEVAY